MDSFYSQEELEQLGFAACGKEVKISRKASFYGEENIRIGDYVRIDDFCLLSGKITLKNHIHISAYTALYGGESGIFMDDYSGVSAHGSVYAATDDYSGIGMTNPTVPEEYRAVEDEPVTIEKYVQIGSNSVVLPGVTLREGSSFGALSFIKEDSEPWSMYAGAPVKRIRERSRNIIELAEKFEESVRNE